MGRAVLLEIYSAASVPFFFFNRLTCYACFCTLNSSRSTSLLSRPSQAALIISRLPSWSRQVLPMATEPNQASSLISMPTVSGRKTTTVPTGTHPSPQPLKISKLWQGLRRLQDIWAIIMSESLLIDPKASLLVVRTLISGTTWQAHSSSEAVLRKHRRMHSKVGVHCHHSLQILPRPIHGAGLLSDQGPCSSPQGAIVPLPAEPKERHLPILWYRVRQQALRG
jgi:hypothetical protein